MAREILEVAYKRAINVLKENITDHGFSAAPDRGSHYADVWTRDVGMVLLAAIAASDEELLETGKTSLETIGKYQTDTGLLPRHVNTRSGVPVYGGSESSTGVPSIDSNLWFAISVGAYYQATKEKKFLDTFIGRLEKAMDFLYAHDMRGTGLLECPDCSDWMDIPAGRFGYVTNTQILWWKALQEYAKLLQASEARLTGKIARAKRAAQAVKEAVNSFWLSEETISKLRKRWLVHHDHFDKDWAVDTKGGYLPASVAPYHINTRCDTLANILAALWDVVDKIKADKFMEYVNCCGINQPYPIKALYPVLGKGDSRWYCEMKGLKRSLPYASLNGGIWPFIGGLWIRLLSKLGRDKEAEAEIQRLAEAVRYCADGNEWGFHEWLDGRTGKPLDEVGNPLSKGHQAWSAAGFVLAYRGLQAEGS